VTNLAGLNIALEAEVFEVELEVRLEVKQLSFTNPAI
jgi:hypothetical protein